MYYPFRRKTISWIFSECPYVLSIPNIKRFVDSLFTLDCKTIRLVPPFLYEDRVQLKLNTVDLPLLPSGGFEDVVIDGTTAFCTDIEKPAMLLSSHTFGLQRINLVCVDAEVVGRLQSQRV